MKRFEILPHTADIRLKVTADNYEELFSAALEGMNHLIKTDAPPAMKFKDVIGIDSVDRDMLLIDFLSSILTLSHQQKAIYHLVRFRKFSNTELIADVEGNKVQEFDEDIKAVTYTEANIRKNEKNEFETVIVFDI